MKTAGSYFMELVRIIVFGMLLAWLVSCNSKQDVITQIHAYTDSLYIAKNQIIQLRQSENGTSAAQVRLQVKSWIYEEKIDSLKLELER